MKKEFNMDAIRETFPLLLKLVAQETGNKKDAAAFYIMHGYMKTWAAEYRNNPDAGIEKYSTAAKWDAYKSGKINREKAAEIAKARAYREIDKWTEMQLAKLESAVCVDSTNYFSIDIEWKRSSVWGYNPHASLCDGKQWFTGKASGYGYDKGSAAIAEALNACPSIMRDLYIAAEKALAEGKRTESKTACTGYSWNEALGYGSGYAVLPYFEGGVGYNSLCSVLRNCGYNVQLFCRAKHYDYITAERNGGFENV